jgi:hypothetical protein
MMTKGFVPWGEYKRMRERMLELMAAVRRPTTA